MLFSVPYRRLRFEPAVPVHTEVVQFHANFLCVETFHAEVGCSGLLFNDPYGASRVMVKPRPSGDEWFVYMVQCADGSLYTGVAKDVARRCQQHNAGTASRYTRSRLPVELVYQEAHPGQSSALKREAAVKAMDRREKLTMAKQSRTQAKAVRQIVRLEDIPNVGPAVARDLRQLGITSPGELPGRDPYAMYDDLSRITGHRHDPCLLDTFIAAVRYMEGAPKKPWWKYTAERKREMAARKKADG